MSEDSTVRAAIMAERKRWHRYVAAHNHARNEAEMYGDDPAARAAAEAATQAWEALGICEVHTADGECLESRPCPIHGRPNDAKPAA